MSKFYFTVNVVVDKALIKDDRGKQCLDEP